MKEKLAATMQRYCTMEEYAQDKEISISLVREYIRRRQIKAYKVIVIPRDTPPTEALDSIDYLEMAETRNSVEASVKSLRLDGYSFQEIANTFEPAKSKQAIFNVFSRLLSRSKRQIAFKDLQIVEGENEIDRLKELE